MTLITEKRGVAFFTSNLHESRWEPIIHLEGQPLRFTPLPKLRGITIDRALSFGRHIAMKGRWYKSFSNLTELKTVGLEKRPIF